MNTEKLLQFIKVEPNENEGGRGRKCSNLAVVMGIEPAPAGLSKPWEGSQFDKEYIIDTFLAGTLNSKINIYLLQTFSRLWLILKRTAKLFTFFQGLLIPYYVLLLAKTMFVFFP